ncbi:MAG: HNH endonuclease signature motif containing protein [Desulfovibrio sp.]|uniref:HNH endonuclease signature motif containing protein n=1 Tax=Desulfovibrio sp. 7SRBS1 TaxID=3378064 RepID=UPI003B41C931
MRFRYLAKHIKFLREGYKSYRIPELTRRFNELFTLNKTEKQIRSTLKNHGIRCNRRPGFEKGERLTYSLEQVEFIKESYPKMSRQELTAAFNYHFGENKEVAQITAFAKRHKIKSGRTGRYEKGHVPWNAKLAGKGVCRANNGSFKKGNVPINTVPMYSERVNKDGFIEIKVPIPNPYTKAKTRFMHKHVWVWEQANGPVPKDYVIRFLDGDKANCSLDNLALYTRAESLEMTRLGFSEMETGVKPTVAMLAKLKVGTLRAERGLLDGREWREFPKA